MSLSSRVLLAYSPWQGMTKRAIASEELDMIDQFVIFGASGDLTARLLLPSLAVLVAEGSVPDGLRIIGAGQEDYTPDAFRNRIAEALATHAAHVDVEARRRIIQALDYRQ